MFNRRRISRVACLAICAFLLLNIAMISLFVPISVSVSHNRSVSTTDSAPSSRPMLANESIPTNESKPTDQLPPNVTIPAVTDRSAFRVVPQKTIVNVSETFVVFVFAENVSDMYAWQVFLGFDSKIMECINVSLPEKHVFSSRDTVTHALMEYNSTEFNKRPLQSVKNNEGYVLAGDCLWVNETTINGSGFLCQFTFRAISAGSSNLMLSEPDALFETYYLDSASLLVPGTRHITPSLSDGQVTVISRIEIIDQAVTTSS